MIKVAVVGATGYVGQELIRLLLSHPQVKIAALVSQSCAGQDFSQVYPGFNKLLDVICVQENLDKISGEVDLVFLALPHGMSSVKLSKKLLQQTRFIDLGADFRLKDADVYELWYQTKHACPALLAEAVYGLSEWHHNDIAKARLVANPGCYATCCELVLLPLIAADIIQLDSIIVDAKSGVSGAGRELSLSSHFSEANETIKAYKVATHRHIAEIEQELALCSNKPVNITFTPHLIPMNRGILVTAYAKMQTTISDDEVYEIYNRFYNAKHFIRLFKPSSEYSLPETRFVKGSNYCDIGFAIDKRAERLVVVGTIDNLIKGAAGQAIQNMNILFGLDETIGLDCVPIFPG